MPGIDRASAFTYRVSLRQRDSLQLLQSSELVQQQIPAFAGKTCSSFDYTLKDFDVRAKHKLSHVMPGIARHLIVFMRSASVYATTCDYASPETGKSRFLPAQERRVVWLITL